MSLLAHLLLGLQFNLLPSNTIRSYLLWVFKAMGSITLF